jgi:hypothetical protein
MRLYLSGLKIEMAKPRSTASVSQGTPKRLGGATPLSPAGVDEIPPTPGTIISAFTGVYERIASKVASGSRKSLDIDAELAAELKTLKEKLARYD